jgi:tryptophan-rich sensory protein
MDLLSIAVLIGFVAACFLAAAMGILFKPGTWYEQLKKPSWRPPNWLFAPVWTLLYLMIAFAGWLVWHAAGFHGAGLALSLYAIQLLLNAAWTPVFFGLHRLDLGFVVIALLWIAIATTIAAFAPLSAAAAWLMVPYLAWVSFASLLNFAVWQLNRDGLSPTGGMSP